jgi:hypothetical protein
MKVSRFLPNPLYVTYIFSFSTNNKQEAEVEGEPQPVDEAEAITQMKIKVIEGTQSSV